jgi:hypothetical protein
MTNRGFWIFMSERWAEVENRKTEKRIDESSRCWDLMG